MHELLPRALYLVSLDDGGQVRAGLASAAKHSINRLIVGDRVTLKVSPYDPHRAQILNKL